MHWEDVKLRCSISSLRELSFLTTQTQADLGFKGWDDCLIAYLLFAHIVRTDSPSGPYLRVCPWRRILGLSPIRHPEASRQRDGAVAACMADCSIPRPQFPLWDVRETPMRKSDGHCMKNVGYAVRSAPCIAISRYARTARPAATGPDHLQTLCSVRYIPSHGLNHVSTPTENL